LIRHPKTWYGKEELTLSPLWILGEEITHGEVVLKPYETAFG